MRSYVVFVFSALAILATACVSDGGPPAGEEPELQSLTQATIPLQVAPKNTMTDTGISSAQGQRTGGAHVHTVRVKAWTLRASTQAARTRLYRRTCPETVG